ncbi:beta-ketoacyl-[acyl-carrier-protein] synthase family protein [Streptomyces sp. ET3-23]|uniref:beta-ketoacyl-[acyl-carrier-protein] synthase family protein n=1 Tax=Streptomyces sp. ET3-23 TaxID=2885643 RepID=UPI001D125AC2|nr:beta-ketoacyl-[acyl-carrier-protein] synthase family protein [Streptomyces sp. ET3-23]MCC2274669.1 beta-ketoacyl-[acyl-carrier-protein] synthase family protein [Streptomyces sp. ET3-23]
MYDNDQRPRRVVITGLGAVTSIGLGVPAFLAGLRAGRSGAKPITAFDTTGFAHSNGCEVTDFRPSEWIRNIDPDELGRATQFSVAAANMAVADSGMSPEDLRGRRALVSVGTTDAESRDLDVLAGQQLEKGPENLDPAVVRRAHASRLSSGIVRELGLTDVEALTIPTACAAGNYAIGSGFDAVREGDADVALCGGADAVCRKTFTGFYRLGTIAPEVCQPFDRDRKGILTGEGAGILMLESLESARARGARIYAEVLGYGLNCDAHHPVAPDQDSLARCMEVAHRNAGITADDVDFISAHGTGTKANDVTEAGAIRQVFGTPPPTVSIKSMIGHSMGAASALGSAACALAIAEGFIPPTINHRETDPDCGVDCVPNEARPADLTVVQNNALAFAGNNAVLILGRYREAD